MTPKYKDILRQRLAGTAIGPSTIRGMAPKGTIILARDFLKRLDLRKFSECKKDELKFVSLLNALTAQYSTEVPQLNWGATRKCLNIFLRDCLYNRWMCEEYELTEIEDFLEVPLDSHVAGKLKSEKDGDLLPRWLGVSKLNIGDSTEFQRHAQNVAFTKGILRVHLDVEYWRNV